MAATDRDAEVRRNRRRMAILTVAGAAMLWLFLAIAIVLIALVFEHHTARALAIAAALTTFAAALLTAVNLSSSPDHLLDRIGAIPLDPDDNRELANLFDEMAIATGLTAVHGAVITDRAPNAIAVGRSPNATTIAVTTGLTELLTRDEAAAVIATEMAAVVLHEVALGTVACACLGQTVDIANGVLGLAADNRGPLATLVECIVALPFRCIALVLERLVVAQHTSRADLVAVEITRNPAALIHAMEKLRQHPADVVRVAATNSDLWFSYPRPMHGTGGIQRSRPTLAERIRAIEAECGVSAERPADG